MREIPIKRAVEAEPGGMAERWLLVADDLTGAADCAIAFAKAGIEAAVGWDDHGGGAETRSPVFSYDAASRELTAAEAFARQQEVLARFLGAGRTLFKKIDSTLRGQPAAEIRGAIETLGARFGRAFGICAPAFPATGRTTEHGRVHVHNRPLEETEVWQRDHSYPSADLVEILATAGITGEKVPLSLVRGGGSALKAAFEAIAAKGDAVAVCDAVTEDDLGRIAAASLPAREGLFFIGSAGLAHALASASPARRVEPIRLARNRHGSLIVVGSLARASREAAASFAKTGTVRHLKVTPELLLDAAATAERAALGREVATGLDAGADMLVEIMAGSHPDLSIGQRLAHSLAEALLPAAPHIGGLAATGGETAAALLDRFGVSGIRLVDEIEPGVSLGLTLGTLSIPVVTKAGAFGDQHSLTRIAARLSLIRAEGNLA
jgi:uncharacterized protein YgbK (DUF1537 family)